MKKLPYTISELKKYLKALDLFPNKKLGQNFLLDRNIHQEIIKHSHLDEKERVLEIGAGLGHLTQCIIQKAEKLWSVEIDKALCHLLRARFNRYQNFTLIEMDILESKHQINRTIYDYIKTPYKIIANLPYYISAPLIVNFLESAFPPKEMIVMVQKEVGQRLIAKHGEQHYGPLSVNTQLYSEIESVMDISPKAFYPSPKVYSRVMRITRKPLPENIKDVELLKNVIKTVFNMKRKTVFNTLRHGKFIELPSQYVGEVLEKAEISPKVRGETISIDKFIELSNNIQDVMQREK